MSRTIRRPTSPKPHAISSAAYVRTQRRRFNRRRSTVRNSRIQPATQLPQQSLASSGHVGIIETHTDDLEDKDD